MKSKIFVISCIIAAILFTGYSLCPAQDNTAPEKEIENLKKELAKETKAAESAQKRLAPLKEENDKLRAQRAAMYEETGIAYTKAGLFDEAINAYKESLKYNPANAQIHYYLGLLYQKAHRDVKKAVAHFKRYLYLEPDAANKEEVKYFIEMLQNKR